METNEGKEEELTEEQKAIKVLGYDIYKSIKDSKKFEFDKQILLRKHYWSIR